MSSSIDFSEKLNRFGRYQTIQYILVCLPLCAVGMSIVNYVFVAEDIHLRCRVPSCDDDVATSDTPVWWPDAPANINSKCYRPLLNITKYNDTMACTNKSFTSEWEECTEWIYETNNSLISGFNLGCQSWMASLVGTVHNAAMIGSMVLAGWISDKIGRKPTAIICSVAGVIGICKIFLSNYYIYLVVEFIESFLSSGLFTVGVVLLIEIGGEKHRVLAGVLFSYATYVGEVVIAFSAMGLKYWKYLILITYVPCIFFITYVFVLQESVRWQMLRGKMDDAKKSFKAIAKINRLDINEKEVDSLSDEDLRRIFKIEEQKEKESIRQIILSKVIMLRLFVVSVGFFSAAFVFCGLIVNSVYLPGDKYINFVLSSVTSFPGDLLAYFTFKKFGRKVTLQSGYFATAIFVLAQAFIPATICWMKIILFLLGKFSVVVCFTGMFTYSMELFPTSVRGTLVGVGNTAARIGTMLSPLTPLLTNYMETLPAILFSTTSILAGILLTFAPETKFLPLLDTIAQVEAYENKEVSVL